MFSVEQLVANVVFDRCQLASSLDSYCLGSENPWFSLENLLTKASEWSPREIGDAYHTYHRVRDLLAETWNSDRGVLKHYGIGIHDFISSLKDDDECGVADFDLVHSFDGLSAVIMWALDSNSEQGMRETRKRWLKLIDEHVRAKALYDRQEQAIVSAE